MVIFTCLTLEIYRTFFKLGPRPVAFQKQSFADVLQNRCSWKFRKFHRKVVVLESLFNKVAVLTACNFIKNRLQHKCFPEKSKIYITKYLRTPFFTDAHRVAVSGLCIPIQCKCDVVKTTFLNGIMTLMPICNTCNYGHSEIRTNFIHQPLVMSPLP